jgi:hypothetical protein
VTQCVQLAALPCANNQSITNENASRGGAATLLQRRVEVLHLFPDADKIVNISFYLHTVFQKEQKNAFFASTTTN